MIICDEIIVLNFPKTGSTFVSKVIKDIYNLRYPRNIFRKIGYKFHLITPHLVELRLPNYQSPAPFLRNNLRNHGAFCQIPKKYLGKKIVSVVRNPYARFLSIYQFKSWERYPPLEKSIIDENLPNFPILSLNDYVQMQKIINKDCFDNNLNIGSQTIQFIRLFFKNPDEVFNKIDLKYVSSDTVFLEDMADIELLRTESLNNDLSNFLSKNNFSVTEVAFAKNYKKVNVTNLNSGVKAEILWTREAIDYIEKSEWFLFKMLKVLGIEYNKPEIN